MNRTERLGSRIVVGVLTLLEVAALVFGVIVPVWLVVNGPAVDRTVLLLSGVWAAQLPGTVYAIRCLWRGREAVRWLLVLAFVVGGSGLIGTVAYVNALDYPDAASPEIRAEMRADDRQIFVGAIGLGVTLLAAAVLLLTPPVGRFLSYRQRVSSATGLTGEHLEGDPPPDREG